MSDRALSHAGSYLTSHQGAILDDQCSSHLANLARLFGDRKAATGSHQTDLELITLVTILMGGTSGLAHPGAGWLAC